MLHGAAAIEELAPGDDINRVLNRIAPNEVLLAMPDSGVYNAENIRNILLSTYRHKQGVIGFSADMVKAGALASTYSDIEDINAQVAEMAAAFVATGELAPPQFPRYFSTIVNEGVARSLDIERRRRRAQVRAPRHRPGRDEDPLLEKLEHRHPHDLHHHAAGGVPVLVVRLVLVVFAPRAGGRGTGRARPHPGARAGRNQRIQRHLRQPVRPAPDHQWPGPVGQEHLPHRRGRRRRRKAPSASSSQFAADAEDHYYEAPIKKQVIWVNLFSDNGSPHVSGPSDTKPPTQPAEVVGWVRVTMSPSNMLAKQARRFQVELAMAALALAVSGALAWFLARSLTVPLRASIGALRQIRGGDYRVRLPVTTGGEIGELQESIAEMSLALDQSKQHLENKVAERTRDLVESRNEALRADADKRKLIQKVNSIVEDERKSIAIEIHDELNASLIAARLESQSILHLAGKAGAGPEIEQIKQKSQAITKLTLDLYASGRRLVRRLRPEVLDMLGLHGAVEEMMRHYDSGTGCRFEFHSEGDFSQLGNELAISAYRIIQEALSNVIKHAGASHAQVALTLSDGGDMLHIEVADDGAGFDVGTRVGRHRHHRHARARVCAGRHHQLQLRSRTAAPWWPSRCHCMPPTAVS